jgi:hypothetical protein
MVSYRAYSGAIDRLLGTDTCSICGHKATWLDCDCVCHEEEQAINEYQNNVEN